MMKPVVCAAFADAATWSLRPSLVSAQHAQDGDRHYDQAKAGALHPERGDGGPGKRPLAFLLTANAALNFSH
jgi:hypothetical protein